MEDFNFEDDIMGDFNFLENENLENDKSGIFESLKYLKLSSGFLKWRKSSGKTIDLLRPGDVINQDYIQKFKKIEKQLVFESTVNDEFIKKGISIWGELSFSNIRENERVEIRDEILNWAAPPLWLGEEDVGLLDLAVVGHLAFYNIPKNIEVSLQEMSLDHFKRSSVMGGVIINLAVSLGHLNFKFLQDLYHACFFNDYALLKKGVSSIDLDCLEMDREGKESGRFYNVGENSLRLLEEENMGLIKSPVARNLIGVTHERVNGKGGPNRFSEHHLTDLEILWILTYRKISLEVMSFKKDDGVGFFYNMLKSNLGDKDPYFTKRVENFVDSCFSINMSVDEEYFDFGGL